MINNTDIAQMFDDLAIAIQMKGAKGPERFKILSYKKAANVIRTSTYEIYKLAKHELMSIEGIGSSISDKIIEFVNSGHIDKLDSLKKDIPPLSINEFTKLKGIGPVGAKKLWEETKAASMAELIVMADAGKLDKGLVEKINFYKTAADRILISEAFELASPIYTSIVKHCKHIAYGGSIRRKKETVHDIDLLVYTEDVLKVKEIFKSCVDTIDSEGDYKVVGFKNNIKVEIAFIKEEKAWGGALFHFTGPKEYNIANRQIAISKNWLLNDKGLWDSEGKQLDSGTEESICSLLEIPFIIPELRELNINVETVNISDIKSDFHIHSVHSDGANTIKEIAKNAVDLDMETIAITDHGKGLRITKIKDLDKYFKDIEDVRKMFPQLTILKGVEANIDKEGNLDYSDEDLEKFDIIVASIHFSTDLGLEEQTNRLLKAINNSHVDILGHITCEEYGVRKPIEVDWNRVFEECKKNDVKIEINSQPSRMFLTNEQIQRAKNIGVKFTFASDCHRLPLSLNCALWKAQRGGLTKNDIWQKPY